MLLSTLHYVDSAARANLQTNTSCRIIPHKLHHNLETPHGRHKTTRCKKKQRVANPHTSALPGDRRRGRRRRRRGRGAVHGLHAVPAGHAGGVGLHGFGGPRLRRLRRGQLVPGRLLHHGRELGGQQRRRQHRGAPALLPALYVPRRDPLRLHRQGHPRPRRRVVPRGLAAHGGVVPTMSGAEDSYGWCTTACEDVADMPAAACRAHTTCPAGSQVVSPGTAVTDTVCARQRWREQDLQQESKQRDAQHNARNDDVACAMLRRACPQAMGQRQAQRRVGQRRETRRCAGDVAIEMIRFG